MEPPVVPDGEVTQPGAAHRAVSLSDVEKARRASVLAYCARVCDPDRIAEATDAAFEGLLSALEAIESNRVVDLDRALLEATRDAAASRSDSASPEAGRVASRRAARTCALVPTLLAARASGRLGAGDRAALERHLARCGACRELERRRDEAEQAYESLLGTPLEPVPATEPFAPGDPDPEVAASRAEPESELAEAEPAEAELAEPAAEEPELAEHEEFEGPADATLLDPPEYEPRGALALEAQPIDQETEPLGEEDTPPEPAGSEPPPSGSSGRALAVVAAVFFIGGLILIVGLIQLRGGDNDNGEAERPAARAAAPAAAPAPAKPAQPAKPEPSPAELRTRARLHSLGDRELGPGTLGDDVKALQKLLGVPPTGNFGPQTTAALTQFQATHDLPETGIADEATKRKLARRRRPPRQAPAAPAQQQQQAQPPAGQQSGAVTPATPPATGTSPTPGQ